KLLKDIKLIKIPCVAPDVKLSWFVYVVELNDKYTIKDRDILINKMAQKGVSCSNYFPPIHLQPFYRKMFGFKPGDFPVTEKVSERTIALPFYNNLSLDNIAKTVSSLKTILNQ
ncbi:MAG: DegT/DnrJ/EryC1/StrS family aminotransferase, partial [Proteobacteria bacterium]|nr:DegT/DnrJ/EryC1/StrS family aminotransferase [Pseudomonadota bacterium]